MHLSLVMMHTYCCLKVVKKPAIIHKASFISTSVSEPFVANSKAATVRRLSVLPSLRHTPCPAAAGPPTFVTVSFRDWWSPSIGKDSVFRPFPRFTGFIFCPACLCFTFPLPVCVLLPVCLSAYTGLSVCLRLCLSVNPFGPTCLSFTASAILPRLTKPVVRTIGLFIERCM